MKLITRTIPITRGRNEFIIRQFTDVHDGATGFDSKLFLQGLREQEKDNNSYCIFTGDIIDADRPSMRDRKAHIYADDGRKEAWTQEDRRNFSWLNESIIPKYKRIAPRCLGILDGDHYLLFSNGMTSGQYICRKTGIPYLGERMAFIRILFTINNNKSAQYVILARHGTGSGSTSGGSVNALERQNHGFIADLYLGAHNHREHIHPLKVVYPDKNFAEIKQKVVWYVRGGTFLNGYPSGATTYAEHNEYRPLCQGWAEVELVVRRPHTNNCNLLVEANSARMIAA